MREGFGIKEGFGMREIFGVRDRFIRGLRNDFRRFRRHQGFRRVHNNRIERGN
jgi:hypothetical protein